MKEGQNSIGENTGNMYSYQGDKKSNIVQSDALRRSLGGKNPNSNPGYNKVQNISLKDNDYLAPDTVIIRIDQSPPLYWMFFVVFIVIQIILLLFIGFYYRWDDYYTNPSSITKNSENDLTSDVASDTSVDITGFDVYLKTHNKYKLFQEVNIMIFLGFGFLRAFLKHYSWTAVALTLIAGVLSTEFGLFMLICWTAIFDMKWTYGKFNFQHLLDANICSGAVIISLGTLLGKISMPQYLVLILTETISVTLNYTLLRQVLKIIDVGGTLTMHLYGSLFGGVFSLISFLSNSEKERIRESRHLGSNYYSNVFSIIGSLIMISYFPAFNTCLIDDKLYRPTSEDDIKPKYEGMINTYFAILGSIISSFCTSPFFNQGKLVIQDILNSSFSGGIAVGGCCHLISHYWVSILFGLFTGAVTTICTNLISERLKFNGYHDTANAFFFHGIPAFIGGIITTIFVGNFPKIIKDKSKQYVYQFVGSFLNYYNDYSVFPSEEIHIGLYAGRHFGAIFITIGIALGCGFLAGFAIKFCNCNIAMRYFNDSEFFDVRDSEPFPWKNENIKLELEYNQPNL